MFDEEKLIAFANDPRDQENDLFFDVTFESEIEAEDNQNGVP